MPGCDVYIADSGTDSVKVMRNASGVPIFLASVTSPRGIVVRPNGDVYFANSNNYGSIMRLVGGSGSPVTVYSGIGGSPTGLFITPEGTMYVTDYRTNLLKKYPGGTVVGSGFDCPMDVAVTPNGDVFVCDGCHFDLKIIPNGTGTPVSFGRDCQTLWVAQNGDLYAGSRSSLYVYRGAKAPSEYVLGGLNVAGVSVASNGDIYIANAASYIGGPPSYVFRYPAGAGGARIALGSGYYNPLDVFVNC
jgi:hypothetical protein